MTKIKDKKIYISIFYILFCSILKFIFFHIFNLSYDDVQVKICDWKLNCIYIYIYNIATNCNKTKNYVMEITISQFT